MANFVEPDQTAPARGANYSDLCGIIPIFKPDFSIEILDIKIMANNFKTVLDKIKEVAHPFALVCTGTKFGLFPFKTRQI